MGKDLEMSWALFRTIISVSVIAFFAVRCDKNQTTHYKYISNSEWSPVSMNSILIAKDEYDVTTSSGCSSSTSPIEEPVPTAFQLFLTDTVGNIRKQLSTTLKLPEQM